MAELAGYAPLRIRVGVTGHRTLPDELAIAEKVDDVLQRLQRRLPSTPTTTVLFEVVSPLGEGADRIVAERVLQIPGAILEAPLPLPRDEYERDFGSDASRVRFRNLLDRADRNSVVGGSDRNDAYRRAGGYVVDSCDLLIAVWDGQPSRGAGGTSDILDLARRRGMPTFVIDAGPPFEIAEERMPASFHLFDEVERYNRIEVSHAPGEERRLLPTSDGAASEEEPAFGPFLSWVEPSFRRADTIAKRFRGRFLAISRLMFLMSALAAFSVAVSVVSDDPEVRRTFAYLEVALMSAALILWLLVRRRLHSRWITSRFLAERLRSAAFLAFVGSGRVMESRPEGEYRGNPQEWLSRVFREVWRSRPHQDHVEIEQAKRLLDLAWVDPQASYYRRRSRGHAAAFGFLTAASAVMFLTAVIAAALHASERFHGGLSEVVAILSIGLPALAGALTGIAALEQHRRHADHFGLMARRLAELSDDLRRAVDLERVRDLAARIEAELRTEANAWIDVMRFQDVDFPAR
jgi:conflict system pore-forming effector with SLATT domain